MFDSSAATFIFGLLIGSFISDLSSFVRRLTHISVAIVVYFYRCLSEADQLTFSRAAILWKSLFPLVIRRRGLSRNSSGKAGTTIQSF